MVAAVFCLVFVGSIQNSYSSNDVGIGRIRSCGSNGAPSGIEFFTANAQKPVPDPGNDLDIVLSNSVCLIFFSEVYVAIKATILAMHKACEIGGSVSPYPSPLKDSWYIARASVKAVGNPKCAGAVAASVAAYSGMAIYLERLYANASDTYNSTEVCGAQWMAANPRTFDISSPNKKQQVKDAVETYIRKGEVEKLNIEDPANVTYREWYYGGEEVTDNPQGGHEPCYDVTQPKVNGSYPAQKYYMRGLLAGNFNCKKYDLLPGNLDPLTNAPITEDRVLELQQAYKCCQNRSANYICLKTVNTKVFCKAGTLCSTCTNDALCMTHGGLSTNTVFSTKALDNGALVCAETYSLCPYNFSIGGGTEYCDYYQDGIWEDGHWDMITKEDVAAGNCSSKSEIRNSDCSYNNKANKCRNYCQYLTHCTTTSLQDYHYTNNLGSPYFSDACINFVGDSQNHTAFGGGFVLNSQKHFSAPIAQCVRETMENLFQNVAGHSRCAGENEYPDPNGNCPSGNYAEIAGPDFPYKKGSQVKEVSFFSLVQSKLKAAVKMALTLSIVFYGMNILIGKADIREKKDILMYLLKIGLVLYFATGDAWQSMFFKGVYGASSEFSQMVFKIDADASENRRDGCQFGMITNSEGVEVSSGRLYPSGKEYLALWDTLDCKMMRYLGYGPEVKVANIASLMLASFLSSYLGGAAIYFSVAIMFFGFCFLALTLRALHIFLASSMALIIMVFVSPIVIPMVLFAKTKSIFEGWVKEIIGYCLQPMILFAYVAFFITIMDKVMIGSATFSGQAPSKAISCSKVCKDSNGTIKPYKADNSIDDCNDKGDKILNPMNDSVACLINLDDFGKMPGLEMFGLTVPILMNIFSDNVQLKILTILKGAIVMFLLYKFMDLIPEMASKLVGGSKLGGGDSNAFKMMTQVAGTVNALAKRGVGAAKRAGEKGLEKAGSLASKAKSAARSAGSQGKSVSGPEGEGGSKDGGDHESNSKRDGADSSENSSGGDSSKNSKSE
ncbi:MAG: type IV secretion system protein [Rickettsiales bacterium]|nr:type IV secretion system protein [Rickettsiales bacterium]